MKYGLRTFCNLFMLRTGLTGDISDVLVFTSAAVTWWDDSPKFRHMIIKYDGDRNALILKLWLQMPSPGWKG